MSVALAECRWSIGGCRPICVSAESRATYRPRVYRHVDRLSADMSVDCWPTYRSTVGRHIGRECRSTEVFITHDPKIEIVPNDTEWSGRTKLHCYTSQSLVLYESWNSLSAHCLCMEKRIPKGTLMLRLREIRRIQRKGLGSKWMNEWTLFKCQSVKLCIN